MAIHPPFIMWWARRPLAAARAVIFASLVDDPADPHANPAFVAACQALPGAGQNVIEKGDTPRMRLFDFIERLVKWESTSDETIMSQARRLIRIATDGKPPPLLDPFAGGGSIPLEAQRLGLEAHASDLNPVAVMINKAMIEIPPRFANKPPVNPQSRKAVTAGDSDWAGAAGLAADVRHYGNWMRERAQERIGHLYPKHNGETVIAWLWARTVISPNPAVNAPVPLVSSFALSKKKGRECWAKPIVEGRTVRFEVTKGRPPRDSDGTMIRRQGARCIISDQPMSFDYLRAQGKERGFGAQLMAIVTQGKQGRNYHNACTEQVRIAESAVPQWRPVGEMQEGNQNVRGRMWGLTDFADLFTPRQLTALTTFSDLVHEARDLAIRDAIAAGLPDDDVPLRDGGSGARAYGEALSVYLAFAVSRTTNRSATVCIWNTIGEKIEQVFGRQAIPMTWDYAESNLLSDSTGNWAGNMDWIGKVLESLPKYPVACQAHHRDANQLTATGQVISTDPPYYDNIGYADLSDYFYIWMRRSLRNLYPAIFGTLLVPKSGELIASVHRHKNKSEAKVFFESGMLDAFTDFRGFVRQDFPLTVYYAFKQQDAGFVRGGAPVASTGWETMLTSLIRAGFSITGTWPMRTERSTGLKARTNSLASSIILVCPAPPSRRPRHLAQPLPGFSARRAARRHRQDEDWQHRPRRYGAGQHRPRHGHLLAIQPGAHSRWRAPDRAYGAGADQYGAGRGAE